MANGSGRRPRLDRPGVHCTARRTNGEQCRNFAIHGGRVCATHGGRAPQVRRAASKRLSLADTWSFIERMGMEQALREWAIEPWKHEAPHWADVAEPASAAARLRRVAREMERTAKAYRAEARRLLRVDAAEKAKRKERRAARAQVADEG